MLRAQGRIAFSTVDARTDLTAIRRNMVIDQTLHD